MDTIKTLRYKLIDNFLNTNEVELLKNYCLIKHRINDNSFDTRLNINGDTYFYGDPLMESLLLQRLTLIEKSCNLELLATYADWKMYSKFSSKDRGIENESCEITVTIMLGSDKTLWPFSTDNFYIELNPGDALIYLGREFEHWREEFQGDWYAQCSLHYVDKNGPYKHLSKDGRFLYGTQKNI